MAARNDPGVVEGQVLRWETLSNPAAPGQAMLRFVVEGAPDCVLMFTTEEWQKIDEAMRDSLSKYQN